MLPVYQKKKQLNRNYAFTLGGIVFLLITILFYKSLEEYSIVIAFTVAILFYKITTRKYRKRDQWFALEFPKDWIAIIQEKVHFYEHLTPEEKEEFLSRCYVFIQEKRIIGVKTEIDDLTRLLVAVSAIIPVMAFDEFDYNHVREVLIYPSLFDENYQFDKKQKSTKTISGMVGNGPMKGVVVFSKPDLLMAYDGKPGTYNVGIHEFAHLIDGADGAIDGIPESILDEKFIKPWLSLVHEEMKKIKYGKSDINKYALTNEQEFLSVVSEYFFHSPDKFKREHPKLFQLLQKMYKTDQVAMHSSVLKEILSFKSVG